MKTSKRIFALTLLILFLVFPPIIYAQNNTRQDQAKNQIKVSNEDESTINNEDEDQEKIKKEIQQSKPSYNPRSDAARQHMSIVAKTVEGLIAESYQIENKGLGDQIREVARAQSDSADKTNQAIDNAKGRGALLKFLLGPDYGLSSAASGRQLPQSDCPMEGCPGHSNPCPRRQ